MPTPIRIVIIKISQQGESIINNKQKRVHTNSKRNYVKRTLRLDKRLDDGIKKVQSRQTKLGNKLSQNKIINIILDNKITKLTKNLLTQKQANLVIKNQQKQLLNQGKSNEIIGGIANNLNQFQRSLNALAEPPSASDAEHEKQFIKDIRKEVNYYYENSSICKNKTRKKSGKDA